MKKAIKYPRISPDSHPEAKRLAALVGELIQFWGFKAVQGRLWCYLFLSGDALNSKELAQLLDVSPALVTQSVQVLLKFGVILEDRKGPNGVLRFSANPEVAQAIVGVLQQRESQLLTRLDGAAQALGETRRTSTSVRVDESRANKIREWIELAQGMLALTMMTLRRDL